jgi:hypothetical protein
MIAEAEGEQTQVRSHINALPERDRSACPLAL